MHESETNGHQLDEKYPRPCFAVCKHCGAVGNVVFADGSLSEIIVSINDGDDVIDKLHKEGKLDRENADRVFSHLICSDLPHTNEQALALAEANLLVAILLQLTEETEEDERRKWN
jgi:hypothetical protein